MIGRSAKPDAAISSMAVATVQDARTHDDHRVGQICRSLPSTKTGQISETDDRAEMHYKVAAARVPRQMKHAARGGAA